MEILALIVLCCVLQAGTCIRAGLWPHLRRGGLWKLHCCRSVASSALPCAKGQTSVAMGGSEWRSLNTPARELRLEFTLPTGQSFRWRQTGAQEFTGVIQQRVVCTASWSHIAAQGSTYWYMRSHHRKCADTMMTGSHSLSSVEQVQMRQEQDDVAFRVLARGEGTHAAQDEAALHDYFNLRTSLAELSAQWAQGDGCFRKICPYYPGAPQAPCQSLQACGAATVHSGAFPICRHCCCTSFAGARCICSKTPHWLLPICKLCRCAGAAAGPGGVPVPVCVQL